MAKRQNLGTDTKIRVVLNKIVPLLKNGKHWDEIPEKEAEELISPYSNESVGNQLRNQYRSVMNIFKDEKNVLYDIDVANALRTLSESVRHSRGRKSLSKDQAAPIKDEARKILL